MGTRNRMLDVLAWLVWAGVMVLLAVWLFQGRGWGRLLLVLLGLLVAGVALAVARFLFVRFVFARRRRPEDEV